MRQANGALAVVSGDEAPSEYRAMRPPTERQIIVLTLLDQWIKLNDGMSPSFRELAKWCDCKSVRTIAEHVNALVRKGLVEKINNEWRTLAITIDGAKAIKLQKPVTMKIKIG